MAQIRMFFFSGRWWTPEKDAGFLNFKVLGVQSEKFNKVHILSVLDRLDFDLQKNKNDDENLCEEK